GSRPPDPPPATLAPRPIPPVTAGGGAPGRIGLDAEPRRAARLACGSDRALESGEVLHATGVRSEAPRMRDEIGPSTGAPCVRQQVVEAGITGRALQALDAAKAAVVEEHADELGAEAH